MHDWAEREQQPPQQEDVNMRALDNLQPRLIVPHQPDNEGNDFEVVHIEFILPVDQIERIVIVADDEEDVRA